MAARPGSALRRRRLVQAVALAPLASSAAVALAAPDAATRYLATVAGRLHLLRPDLLRLGARLQEALPPSTLAAVIAAVAESMAAAVGPVLASAEATVPGLIADDFEQGRVLQVEGIAFSHTEVALLGALDRERARAVQG